jgi:serine/threonine-protein kinase ATR
VAEAEFKQVKSRLPDDEAAWFYHASYLDQLLKDNLLAKGDKGEKVSSSQRAPCPFDKEKLVAFTFRGYLQALRKGTKRLHFILNRVLQLAWDCCETNLFKEAALKELQAADTAKHIEPWMWYVVLPQLISRVNHKDMQDLFAKIIGEIVVTYPHQAAWQVLLLKMSSVKETNNLTAKVFLVPARQKPASHQLLAKYLKLYDSLIKLAQYNPQDPPGTPLQLDRAGFSNLIRAPTQVDQWRVLVPLQSLMTAAIPRDHAKCPSRASLDPFPDTIFSERCINTVDVFKSKEKPKKLTFVGDDGKLYPFLCKSERRGDLRKDSRLMEFGVMVNQLLQKCPDARRRNLEVRTFNVVILKEDCGLIEWVPNTKGMKNIIDDLWRHQRPGAVQSVRDVKEILDTCKSKYEAFIKQVLPRHPPILHRWFSLNADPSVWLSKRLLFTRSQALWSMLGYIVGLGDRHGENILVDQESGRMVHVDFDCLFGKGMSLETPECVPFRLTQNCVAAMGVTGVEGVFRNCCELSMGVLRDRANKQTLLSVLHVFIADPLIDWSRSRGRTDQRNQDEKQGRIQEARTTIGDVEKKLNGMLNTGAVAEVGSVQTGESVLSPEERCRNPACQGLGKDRGAGLSVAGQVDELLKAAMCKRNLSEMYVGWQAWQ